MAQKHKRSNREIRKPKKTAAARSAEAAVVTVAKAASIAVAIKRKR